MTLNFGPLDDLHRKTQWCDTTVGQAFVEQWDLNHLTEVEAEAREARDEWARAVGTAWPEVRAEVRRLRQELDEARERAAFADLSLTRCEAELARARPVVEAAEAWRDAGLFGLGTDRTFTDAAEAVDLTDEALRAAVDAYRSPVPEGD